MRHLKTNRELQPNTYFVDKFIYVVGTLAPLTAVPQLYSIWASRSAGSVSLLSSLGYLFVAASWLAYGLYHREKPIIITSLLWVVMDALIVVGVIIFH